MCIYIYIRNNLSTHIRHLFLTVFKLIIGWFWLIIELLDGKILTASCCSSCSLFFFFFFFLLLNLFFHQLYLSLIQIQVVAPSLCRSSYTSPSHWEFVTCYSYDSVLRHSFDVIVPFLISIVYPFSHILHHVLFLYFHFILYPIMSSQWFFGRFLSPAFILFWRYQF